KVAGVHVDIAKAYSCSLSLQEVYGAFGLSTQFGRQCRDAQFVAMQIEHLRDQEIPACKSVLMHAASQRAHDCCDWSFAVDFGHVTGLAGALLWVIAVQPFEVRHLLRKEPQVLAARPKRFGVQRVAGCAKGRVTNVSRLSRAEAVSRTL